MCRPGQSASAPSRSNLQLAPVFAAIQLRAARRPTSLRSMTDPCHRGAYPTMRVNVRIGCSEVSADVTQGEPHLSGRGEAINAGWGACLDEKLCKVRVEATANRSRVGRRHARYGPRVGERVVAVAEEPIEQYSDGEQVGGDVPASEADVGWLIRRCA